MTNHNPTPEEFKGEEKWGEEMTEIILGALIMVNVYLFIQWRNERRARHNQFERLQQHFYNHVEADKKRIAEQNKLISTGIANIHARINLQQKEKSKESP